MIQQSRIRDFAFWISLLIVLVTIVFSSSPTSVGFMRASSQDHTASVTGLVGQAQLSLPFTPLCYLWKRRTPNSIRVCWASLFLVIWFLLHYYHALCPTNLPSRASMSKLGDGYLTIRFYDSSCTDGFYTAHSRGGKPRSYRCLRVAVSAMRLPNQIDTKEPQPNYKFVAYNCTVQNVNASDRPVSIDCFTAQDTRSNSCNCSDLSNDLTISNFKGLAHSQPGDILGGIVVFEVSHEASVLSITYFDGSTRIVTTVLPV